MNLRNPLLKIENLKMHINTYEGKIKAVDGVDLELFAGEIIGIVGESGSGKSMTSRISSEAGGILRYCSSTRLARAPKVGEIMASRGTEPSTASN